jgi:hypothetical protein
VLNEGKIDSEGTSLQMVTQGFQQGASDR